MVMGILPVNTLLDNINSSSKFNLPMDEEIEPENLLLLRYIDLSFCLLPKLRGPSK